jgi:Flp pilus assembly protein TadD
MLALLDAAEPETGRRAASQLRLDYPESPAAHLLEGLGWLRLGLPERALLAFRAARYLAPELAEIRYLLGRTLAELGRRDQARREFRAALAASERPSGAIWAELPRLGVPDLETIRMRCRELVGGETNISD